MVKTTALIRIKNLSHRFQDGNPALDGIDLEIDDDSFCVICGENGSGKTVLMKHLNGILQPASGEVMVDGISVSDNPRHACEKIGFVFQNSATQFVAQTVRDDIAFGPENIGLSRNDISLRVEQAAESLDITDILEQSPHRLSGGEKKKTAIAGILAMNPKLIVFDEPFAGLDFKGVRMLLTKMLELRAVGTAVIVITHDLEKVLAHADRLIILSDGKVAGSGKPAEMLKTAEEHGMRIPRDGQVESMTWLGDD